MTLDDVQRGKPSLDADRHGIVVDPINRVLHEELRKVQGSDFEVVTPPPGYVPPKFSYYHSSFCCRAARICKLE